MSIQVGNYAIHEPAINILNQVKSELTNGKLKIIRDKGEDIQITCPFHHEGLENRPSCYIRKEDGIFHCFTCSTVGGLAKFVGACFDKPESFGERWLISHYGDTLLTPTYDLPDIVLNKLKKPSTMDESILESFESYHPYMKQRKLSDEVIDKFEVKFDKDTNCLVFPVRNKFGKLSFLTRRSVSSKKFIIDTGIKKEVYLLYDVIKNRCPEVYIAESQINALVAESYGKKAVATFGCGCPDYQINDLNNTDVRHYIIAFDPDPAGLKGTLRLCDNLSKSKFISVMILPKGKDIGDLTEEEFNNCEIVDKDYFIKHIPDYYTK